MSRDINLRVVGAPPGWGMGFVLEYAVQALTLHFLDINFPHFFSFCNTNLSRAPLDLVTMSYIPIDQSLCKFNLFVRN